MIILFACILALVALFFLSNALTRSLAILCYRFFKSEKTVMYLLALLFFPGTLLHEFAHLLTAGILFVPIGKLELFPYKTEDGVRLGSVQIAKTDPFRRALIGLAPIFYGLAVLFAIVYYFSQLPLTPWFLNIIIIVCSVFEIGNTMFSSKKDVEGLPALILVLLVFGVGGYMLGLRIPPAVFTFIESEKSVSFLTQLLFYIAIPIVVDVLIIILARIFRR